MIDMWTLLGVQFGFFVLGFVAGILWSVGKVE